MPRWGDPTPRDGPPVVVVGAEPEPNLAKRRHNPLGELLQGTQQYSTERDEVLDGEEDAGVGPVVLEPKWLWPIPHSPAAS